MRCRHNAKVTMNKKDSIPSPTRQSLTETRRIYAMVFEQQKTSPPKTILVTSGWRHEGKTTLTCNLAALSAQEKKKNTLLIDCNWFAPRVHTHFNIPELPPTDAPRIPIPPLHNVANVPGIENLSVLTAPALPRSESWKYAHSDENIMAFLKKTKATYAQVFIDAPSVFPTNRNMNDPMSLSNVVDGVILVSLVNVTSKSKTKRACCALQANGAPILGVVANQWRNPLARS
ncbi:Chromosome partitioning ATPase, Mrp family, contains Fe-S cluster [Desulfoluna spongiiphila]|uniref:Chromosome partitioning ATPase, Mrp family, contains Fe-S cluster n=2 Tax=Desulfoluna spongiiphila TaxID=419481 RepID=A0A1G5C045_9BACT|nr:Chromosome partitioning ATPase, Mrp family, contains Fe-S cluster [Desulfoluna spongiiphila]